MKASDKKVILNNGDIKLLRTLVTRIEEMQKAQAQSQAQVTDLEGHIEANAQEITGADVSVDILGQQIKTNQSAKLAECMKIWKLVTDILRNNTDLATHPSVLSAKEDLDPDVNFEEKEQKRCAILVNVIRGLSKEAASNLQPAINSYNDFNRKTKGSIKDLENAKEMLAALNGTKAELNVQLEAAWEFLKVGEEQEIASQSLLSQCKRECRDVFADVLASDGLKDSFPEFCAANVDEENIDNWPKISARANALILEHGKKKLSIGSKVAIGVGVAAAFFVVAAVTLVVGTPAAITVAAVTAILMVVGVVLTVLAASSNANLSFEKTKDEERSSAKQSRKVFNTSSHNTEFRVVRKVAWENPHLSPLSVKIARKFAFLVVRDPPSLAQDQRLLINIIAKS